MSRTTTIQVVARQATAQPPADEPPDVRTIGAKLGALYIFIGTIGVQDEKLRLNVSLIDVRSGLHAWSSHFTEDRNRWPSLEDEIVRRATFAVHYQLIRRGDDSLVAPGGEATVSQLLARGWAGITDRGLEEFSTAGAAFSEVLRRDPESRSAMLGLAAYYIAAVAELKLEREPYLTRAEDLMHRILPLRMNDHSAHFHLALLHNLRNNLPAALQALDRAIELNPTHAPAYAHKGRVLIRLQRYEEALENIQYALRLSGGTVPEGWKFWSGMAELELGRDDEARQSFGRVVAALPRNAYVHAGLAAFHAISGEWEDAYRHAAEVRRLTPQLSDQQRLTELNKGPDSHPLQNRLGSGLRLALDATGQQQ